MTVRERVAAIQRELREGNVPPSSAREMATQLAGLVGNINAELLDAEMAYNAVLLRCYGEEQTANRAKLQADTSPEYRRYREAKDTLKLVVTMRSTLHTVLRSLTEEMRMA